MATLLNRTKRTKNGGLAPSNVTRELVSTGHKNRPLICSLEMGDYLTFRAKGTRTKYTIHLKNVYYLAMMKYIQERYEKKLEKYKDRKAAGLRAVRPSKPRLVGVGADTLSALAMKA
jgi:hypothetical protein